MAAATLLLGSIAGCTLTLHYDDVTLQAGAITLDNSRGAVSVACDFTAQGVSTQNVTISPGLSTQMNFLPPATVAPRTVNGKTKLFVQGLVLAFQAVPS